MRKGAESCLVLELKEKQHQNLILHELKENVHKQKIIFFERVDDGVFRYQGRLCVPMVDELKERSCSKLISLDIPFTWVPKRMALRSLLLSV